MSIKLETGKRYVRRDGDITGPLVDNSVDSLYPFKDPTTYQTYTSEGRYFSQHIQDADLVSEYTEPTPKQGTLPAEPVPGKFYRTKNDDKVLYVGKAQNMWVYDFIESGYNMTLSKYHKPFMYYNVEHSENDIVSEWKEPVTLPPVEIKSWYVVQSTDHPTLTTIKRGDVLFVADTKEKAEAYISGDKDCEIVEVTVTLPRKEDEG